MSANRKEHFSIYPAPPPIVNFRGGCYYKDTLKILQEEKSMKKIIALMLALCMVFSLAACSKTTDSGTGSGSETTGGETANSGSESTPSNGASLTVDIWDSNQLEGLRKIADDWSANTGVKVQLNVITWVEYWTLLEAGASGGEMPDVFWMHINEAQKYMRADKLLNLNDYIAADDAIDLNNYYEGIVNIYNLDGNQYAVPKDHDTIALLYNKTIFDKYGVEYPNDTWTWDDYAAAAARITASRAFTVLQQGGLMTTLLSDELACQDLPDKGKPVVMAVLDDVVTDLIL
jgi:ABC-type glycerol-3-phosphate transport system substrate-binding protein